MFVAGPPLVLVASAEASAAEVPADPSNYQELLATLSAGDTLLLEAGTYPRLTISGIHGSARAWITIRGPEAGDAAVVVGESCCNTVQLYDSSYVAIESLTVDVQGLNVDAVNAKDSISHHIRIEGNTLLGFPKGQQGIVGINTKSTAFGWTIRGNRILAPGTGLYLGDSDGSSPFIDGLVENNLVLNPAGYCMQVKHQNAYSEPAGLPAGPHRTVIRHNVFIKDDSPSPSGARPNLLVGGFPDEGPGAQDLYEIYGNFIFYNPNEALFQGTGRMSIHDNVLVGGGGTYAALALTPHQGHEVRLAHVYNNTIYGVGTGVSLLGSPPNSAVVGNLVFADTAISGDFSVEEDNLTLAVAAAADYVQDPTPTLGVMDFYPKPGAVSGGQLDLSVFVSDEAWNEDYNGAPKGRASFRGAYAGEGDNPGCPLDASIDCVPSDEEGGGDGDETGGDQGTDGGAGDGADDDTDVGPDEASDDEAEGGTGDPGDGQTGGSDLAATGGKGVDEEGCACVSAPSHRRLGGWAWALAFLSPVSRRRRTRVAKGGPTSALKESR